MTENVHKTGQIMDIGRRLFCICPKTLEKYSKFMKNGVFMDILNKKICICPKMCTPDSFQPYTERIRQVVSRKYGLTDLPILYGVNFGHTSPICILPYGAEAELDMENLRFTILESGVCHSP